MAARNSTPSSSVRPSPKPCIACGKPITGVKPSELARRKFCSRACMLANLDGAKNPNWKGGSVRLNCLHCGAPIETVPANVDVRKHCSRACLAATQSKRSGEASPLWKGGRKAVEGRQKAKVRAVRKVRREARRRASARCCKACNKPGITKGQLYHRECSPRPGNKSVVVRCLDCGTERVAHPHDDRPLPVRCRACSCRHRRGSNNANWKGGITPVNRKIRSSEAYKAWRTAVFERDGYTCVWCGQRGGKLNADHIRPFSTHPDLRFELSNGRTLCLTCHMKTDTYLNKAKKQRRHRQLSFGFAPTEES